MDAPENVATLIRVIVKRLGTLISDHTFPSTNNASVSAFASSLMKTGSGLSGRDATKEVLNCIRILQRVLPVVFEIGGESYAFEQEVFWKRQEVDRTESSDGVEENPSAQFVIDDEEEDEEDAQAKSSNSPAPRKEEKSLIIQYPTLSEKLFGYITDLLFCCGFTLPTKIQKDHYKINYVIW